MENDKTTSKRKQLLTKTGDNSVEYTRDEVERDTPDPYRFRHPQSYMTEEELKYFKSPKQRELFKEKFWVKND